MMMQCGNRIRLSSLLFIALLLFSTVSSATYRVLLIKPEVTLNFLSSEHQVFKTEVEHSFWESTLGEDYSLDIKPESGLDKLLDIYAFIILPGIVCLSESNILSLNEYHTKKGGLLLIGENGIRNIGGDNATDLTERLFESEIQKVNDDDRDSYKLQFRYGLPGSMALPPGKMFRLAEDAAPLFLTSPDGTEIGAVWKNMDEPLYDNLQRRALQ